MLVRPLLTTSWLGGDHGYGVAVADRRYPRWLWTLVAIPPIVQLLTTLLAPEPHGHWSEHLGFAVLKSAQLVLLLFLATMLGWRTLGWLLMISFAVVAAGVVVQVIGDYKVAASIWRTTGDPGFGIIGYAEGHNLSELGDLLVTIGGFAFAVIAGVTRRVPAMLAVVAAVMVIIPPPFFWPAAGVLVLVLYGLTSASRFERARLHQTAEAYAGVERM